jgi:hypothetical protein
LEHTNDALKTLNFLTRIVAELATYLEAVTTQPAPAIPHPLLKPTHASDINLINMQASQQGHTTLSSPLVTLRAPHGAPRLEAELEVRGEEEKRGESGVR